VAENSVCWLIILFNFRSLCVDVLMYCMCVCVCIYIHTYDVAAGVAWFSNMTNILHASIGQGHYYKTNCWRKTYRPCVRASLLSLWRRCAATVFTCELCHESHALPSGAVRVPRVSKGIPIIRRSPRPRGLRRGSAVARLLGLRVRIPPGGWMSVGC